MNVVTDVRTTQRTCKRTSGRTREVRVDGRVSTSGRTCERTHVRWHVHSSRARARMLRDGVLLGLPRWWSLHESISSGVGDVRNSAICPRERHFKGFLCNLSMEDCWWFSPNNSPKDIFHGHPWTEHSEEDHLWPHFGPPNDHYLQLKWCLPFGTQAWQWKISDS